MSKTWTIARHHFLLEARKRSFLLVLFSMPLFLLVTVGFAMLVDTFESRDEAGLLGIVDTEDALVDVPVHPLWRMYESADAAAAALDADAIAAYAILSRDDNGGFLADILYTDGVPSEAIGALRTTARTLLVGDVDPAAAERLLGAKSLSVTAISANRSFAATGPDPATFLPLLLAVMFVFLILTTSGYLLNVIVTEKEHRTMELMLSSVSTRQLMSGKIAGALAIAALQLFVWLGCLALALWVGRAIFDWGWLAAFSVPWRDVGALLLLTMPAYVLIGALLTIVGGTLIESQEAQQLGGLFIFPLFIPIYLLVPLSSAPNGAVAQAMTYIPFTAPVTFGIRTIFMQVPWHQIALGSAISTMSAVALIWLAGQALRFTLLRYGKRVSLRELFASTGHSRALEADPHGDAGTVGGTV